MATLGRSNTGKHQSNTAKLTYAAQHIMPEILQELLDVKEPCHMIADHVKNDRRLWRCLRKTEQVIISNAATEGYLHFDIPLIYKVLRSLNTVPSPTKGWGHETDPDSSETSVGDDIERVRRYRNKIAHTTVGNCTITDRDLTQWFSAFKDVATRMEIYLSKGIGHFTNKLKNLETHPLTDEIKDSILNTIKCLEEQVYQLQQDIDNFHINDAMELQIEEWEKMDERFVPTDLCAKLLQKLQEYDVITIYGIFGIGKSATIHHAALVLREQSQYEIIPCHSPEDMKSKFKKNKNQVFVFDDVCGRYSAIQNEIDSWIKYEPLLKSITREWNVKVITSCRLQVFREEQFQRIGFLNDCSIKFTDNLITEEQKLSISKKYLDPASIPAIRNVFNKCDFFPLMCSLYENHTKQDVIDFFENPQDIYMSEFDNIKLEPNKVKYFTIIFIVLCNGELCFPAKENNNSDNHSGQHEIWFKNLLEDCGVSNEMPKSDIIMHLDSLVGTFLKTEYYRNIVGKHVVIYRPIHAKLFDYMCLHCGLIQHFQNVIIKYACSSLLSQRTCLESLAESEKAPIVISIENEEEYFRRMIRDILDVKSEEVFKSHKMKCPEYRKKLVRFLKCNADLLKDIFYDKNIGRKVLGRILASNWSDLVEAIIDKQDSLKLFFVLDLAYCYDKRYISKPGERFCLNKATISVNKRRYTPLVCAILYGHTEIVKLLLSQGASINFNASHRKCSPLLAAVMGNFCEIVDIILENREVDVNLADNRKVTPLLAACNAGNIQVVRSLKKKGARLDACDECGQTALMFASRHGYINIVQFLCEHGANVNLKSRKKWTPLMFACKGGHKNIACYLIEKGACVNGIGKPISTPLHIAYKQQFFDLCAFLIEKGANTDKKDKYIVSAIKPIETEDNISTNGSIRADINTLNNAEDIAKSENND